MNHDITFNFNARRPLERIPSSFLPPSWPRAGTEPFCASSCFHNPSPIADAHFGLCMTIVYRATQVSKSAEAIVVPFLRRFMTGISLPQHNRDNESVCNTAGDGGAGSNRSP
jgi:hypothetical protein